MPPAPLAPGARAARRAPVEPSAAGARSCAAPVPPTPPSVGLLLVFEQAAIPASVAPAAKIAAWLMRGRGRADEPSGAVARAGIGAAQNGQTASAMRT